MRNYIVHHKLGTLSLLRRDYFLIELFVLFIETAVKCYNVFQVIIPHELWARGLITR